MLSPASRNKLSFYKDRLLGKKTDINPSVSVFRNMALLASGSGVARGVGVISIPIITRIYSPEDMGVLSVFVALTTILVPFGTLRYSVALPLPKNDRLAINLAVLCLISLGLISVFLGLLLWLFASPLLTLLDMKLLLPYCWLVIFTVFGAGLYEILSQWATREKTFKLIGKTRVWQSLSGSFVKISLGLLALKPLGLLLGHMVTQAGGILSLANGFKEKFKADQKHVTKRRILLLLKHYSIFPKYRLPSQFLLVFSVQAPLLFSAKLFGSETTGQLGLALTALALPMSLFGQTTGQAYYAEIAKISRKNPEIIFDLSKSITKKLFLISLPFFLILLLGGPYLFDLVFGKEWRVAGVFASILSIYLLAQFVSSPLVNALTVFKKQWIFLRINIIRAVGICIIFGSATVLDLSALITVLIYSVALSIHYVFTFISVLRVIKYEFS